MMESTANVKLSLRVKLAYSIGHVLNDLCASMWFTYLLLFFHFVLRFNNNLSGIVLLVGQVADGLATPFVGIEADRVDNFFLCRYGRRKTWHLIGTVCVLCSFPFIFMQCLGCESSSPLAQLIYFSSFVVIFQFGWASVQISHLSLIPDLTKDPNERTELNALRYAFTVISNICVYAVTWFVLGISVDRTNDPSHVDRIGPEDLYKFRYIVFVVMGVGATHSFLFHLGVKEERVADFSIQREDSSHAPMTAYRQVISQRMTWKSWFSQPQFYQESIAIIPLVMYLSGFVSSFFMKAMNKHAGRKITFAVGIALGLSACIWLYFGESEGYKHLQLYFVASLLGIGSSTMLITSLSITADLIGNNVESGAFVYGAMSFTDKLSNGFAVIAIQNLNPCQTCCDLCAYYYKDILAFVGGGTALAAFIILLTLIPCTIGLRRNSDHSLLIQADDDADHHVTIDTDRPSS